MQNKISNFTEIVKRLCFIGCLFVCPLLFLTDTTQNPFVIQPLSLSIFCGVFVLCYIIESILKKEINLRYSKLDVIFVIFLFSLLFSLIVNYFFSDSPAALINEFLRKSDYLIFGLIFGFLFAKLALTKIDFKVSSYKFFKNIFIWCLAWFLWKIQASAIVAVLIFGAGVYLCFLHLGKYGIKEILDIMLAVCFCACLYGIMQAFGFELFWVLDISKEFGARPVSTFGNPNFLASFVLLFLPYSMLLFLQAKTKQENLISGFIVLVLSLFLMISGTRSSWVGLVACGLIFFICAREFRKIFLSKFIKILILFLVFCTCTFALVFGLKNHGNSAPGARISEAKQVLSLNTLSLQSKHFIQPLHQRLMMWHCALSNFKNSPVMGKGVNSFQLNYPYCQGQLIAKNPALDKMKMQANNAHNEYLEILSDGGLISFAIYVFLLFSFFATFKKEIKNLTKEEKYFYIVLMLGLVSVLIDNLFNITLRTLLVSFAFWFILSSINNISAKNKKVGLNRISLFIISALICLFIYSLINFQTRYFIAQTHELSGYKNLIKGNYKHVVEDMDKAIKLSSIRPEPYYISAKANMNLNEFEKAKKINEEALKLYPAYYEFHFYLASLEYVQQNYTGALVHLRKTLNFLPTYSPAAELFANILLGQNYVCEEDKKILQNLVEILPHEPNLSSYLAEIYFKEKDCQNANIFALKTLQKNIFDKTALKIATNCKNDNANTEFLQRAKKINALKEKLKLKQDETVFEEIKKLKNEYSDETEVDNLLSEFYFRQGKYCEATYILKQIKGDKFRGKSYNLSLALSAQKCGDKETAKRSLEEILDFCPYDEFVKNRLKNVNI